MRYRVTVRNLQWEKRLPHPSHVSAVVFSRDGETPVEILLQHLEHHFRSVLVNVDEIESHVEPGPFGHVMNLELLG